MEIKFSTWELLFIRQQWYYFFVHHSRSSPGGPVRPICMGALHPMKKKATIRIGRSGKSPPGSSHQPIRANPDSCHKIVTTDQTGALQ